MMYHIMRTCFSCGLNCFVVVCLFVRMVAWLLCVACCVLLGDCCLIVPCSAWCVFYCVLLLLVYGCWVLFGVCCVLFVVCLLFAVCWLVVD